MDGLLLTSPCLAVVIRFPSAVEIFLLGYGEYVEKYLSGGSVWLVALDSSIQ